MKKIFYLISIFIILITFSCPRPSSSQSPAENELAPLPPHVTVEDLKGAAYAGERTRFDEGENKDEKYLYILFTSTQSGNNVSARIGKGTTAEAAKNQVISGAGKYEPVKIKFPLTLGLGMHMTLYMDKDLQKAITKKGIYTGNSIIQVTDATLYKQN